MISDKFSHDYLAFLKKYWLGFWVPCLVKTPFGEIAPFFAGEQRTLLIECDLDSIWSHEEILRATESTAKRYFGRAGFYFTSGWKGDVDAFKAFIKERGYEKNITFINQATDHFTESLKRSDLEVKQAKNKEEYGLLYQRSFGAGNVEKDRIVFMIERQLNAVENVFLYACDKEEKLIGTVAYAWEGDIGYYYMLGVLPELRGKGYGTFLARQATSELFKKGCKHVTTISAEPDAQSRAIKKTLGYQPFSEWEIWLKN